LEGSGAQNVFISLIFTLDKRRAANISAFRFALTLPLLDLIVSTF
jgi:hypothetical protein